MFSGLTKSILTCLFCIHYRCVWDEGECGEDDITTTLTDLGICFTFNEAKPGVPVKHIERAGMSHETTKNCSLAMNIEFNYYIPVGTDLLIDVKSILNQYQY